MRRLHSPQVVLIAVLVLSVSLGVVADGSGQGGTSWTIMMYMANDSTNPLPLTDNVNAMESAPQAEGTNVLALVDEPGTGNSRILKVQHDSNLDQTSIVSTVVDDGNEVVGPSDEVNMGDGATLRSFVVYVAAHWPADRYVLVLWGHGAGWDGLCPDGADILELQELSDSLGSAVSVIGRQLDIVAVDACAEASIELLYQIRSSASYFVGAESDIPSQGLPYGDILSGLSADPEQGPESFAASIVDEYIAWSAAYSQYSATLGVFNLSRVDELVDMLSELSVQGLRYDSIFHGNIHDAISAAEYYGEEWNFDLGDFLELLQDLHLPLEIRALALKTLDGYYKMVEHFSKFDHPDPVDAIGVAEATGAVIYAPSSSIFDSRYSDLELTLTQWDEFGESARLVAPTNDSAVGPQLTYADVDSDGNADTAYLIWETAYPSVTAWVFRRTPNGMTLGDVLESDKGGITISDMPGVLQVAASASVGGIAKTYDLLTIVLYGTVTIEVRLFEDGVPRSEGYDVKVVSTDLVEFAAPSGERFFSHLLVPSQAEIGQLVQVQVIDDRSGRIVSSELVFVPEDYGVIDVEVFTKTQKEQPGFWVLILFSLLPGILVLGYAAALYLDMRRSRK